MRSIPIHSADEETRAGAGHQGKTSGEEGAGAGQQVVTVRFPYAVVEVKLGDGVDRPPWVSDLLRAERGLLMEEARSDFRPPTANHLLMVEAPKFSKFLHGMALAHPRRCVMIRHHICLDLDVYDVRVRLVWLIFSHSSAPPLPPPHRLQNTPHWFVPHGSTGYLRPATIEEMAETAVASDEDAFGEVIISGRCRRRI